MAISDSSLWKDAEFALRKIIASGVTDPVSASRPTDSKFVTTHFPQRPLYYPYIIVHPAPGWGDVGAFGPQQNATRIECNFDIHIFATNPKQKNQLAGSVYNTLRTFQFGSPDGSGTDVQGLRNFRLINSTDIDRLDIGTKKGEFRKILGVRYDYYYG